MDANPACEVKDSGERIEIHMHGRRTQAFWFSVLLLSGGLIMGALIFALFGREIPISAKSILAGIFGLVAFLQLRATRPRDEIIVFDADHLECESLSSRIAPYMFWRNKILRINLGSIRNFYLRSSGLPYIGKENLMGYNMGFDREHFIYAEVENMKSELAWPHPLKWIEVLFSMKNSLSEAVYSADPILAIQAAEADKVYLCDLLNELLQKRKRALGLNGANNNS